MLTERDMAQPYEGRRERRSSNGAHANHVREDMAALQKDFSKLRSDLGTLAAMQWRSMSDRFAAGGVSEYALIDADRRRREARDERLQRGADRLVDVVALYQALGGGGIADPPAPDAK